MAKKHSGRTIKRRRPWLTEGLLVAILPFVGYLYAFSYESSFCQFYGIPIDVIDISLTRVLFVIGLLIGSLLVLYLVLLVVWPLLPRGDGPLRREFLFSLFLLATFTLVYWPIGSSWKERVGALVIAGFLIALYFLWPLLTIRGKQPYVEKLRQSHKQEDEAHPRTLTAFISQRFGFGIIVFGYLLFVGWSFSGNLGRSAAEEKTDYFVLSTSPESVVLRIYGSKVITAQLDRASKQLTRTVRIYEMSQLSAFTMRHERVGPLTVEGLQ